MDFRVRLFAPGVSTKSSRCGLLRSILVSIELSHCVRATYRGVCPLWLRVTRSLMAAPRHCRALSGILQENILRDHADDLEHSYVLSLLQRKQGIVREGSEWVTYDLSAPGRDSRKSFCVYILLCTIYTASGRCLSQNCRGSEGVIPKEEKHSTK